MRPQITVELALSRSVRLLGILVLFGAMLGGFSRPVAAEVSFSVNPGLVDLAGQPGSTGSQRIDVRNDGDEEITLSVAIAPNPQASSARSAVSWLFTGTDHVTITPRATEFVTVTIAIPDDAASGGYYARVAFTSTADSEAANTATIAGELAIGFMITVDGNGEVERTARIGRFAPVLESDGRVGFRIELINSGNVHLIEPVGTVVVTEAGGADYGNLPVPAAAPLLPENTAVLTTLGSLPMSDGAGYHADATVSWSGTDEVFAGSVEFTNTPYLDYRAPTICENLDRGPTFTLELINSGDLGLQPLVMMTVSADSGGSLGSAPLAAGELLWPAEVRTLTVDYPERLPSGSYTLVTSIAFDPREEPITIEIPFQIGGLTGEPIPLCTSS